MTRPHVSAGRRRPVALMGVGALLAGSGLAALGASPVTASSHREAPMIAGLPQYDNTDVYAFVSPDRPDTVTLIANWIPFEEPAGGPNFYPWANDAHYDIRVDNDGNGSYDQVYRWDFSGGFRNGNTFLYNTGPVTSLTDPDLNFRQTYDLKRWTRGQGWTTLLDNAPSAPSNVGQASMPDYAALSNAAVRDLPGGGRAFAGQADDSFFLDLRVFDLLYGGDLSEVGDDTLAGFNVNTVALQLPKSALVDRDPVIGVWSTTSKRTSSGSYTQVSRLGNPLVNEVVIPVKDKDRFNASYPPSDAQFLDYVTKPELPKLIEAVYGNAVPPAPKEPRNDLVSVFLTGVEGLNQPRDVRPSEMLRLNTSIRPADSPKRLGVLEGDKAGFPNGRRLTDDVVDIELQVVQGELVGQPNNLGDAVNRNDKDFRARFPYVALPTSGSRPDPHRGSGYALPVGGAAPDVPPGRPLTLPVGLVGAGGLVLLAGLALARRSRRTLPAAA